MAGRKEGQLLVSLSSPQKTVVTSNTATWSQLSRISCLLPSPVRMKRRISSAAADALVALLLTSNSAVPLILTCR